MARWIDRMYAALQRRLVGDTLIASPGDLDVIRLNIKNLAYGIASDLERVLPRVDTSLEPRAHGLTSKATTQKDIESPWFVHWCSQLGLPPAYDRKLWEFAFVLQHLFERDMLRPGRRGLGFGCGEEPIPSYLVSRGVEVTITDLDPAKAKGLGWMETGQHTGALEQAYKPALVARDAFERLARLEFVDMNEIPRSLDGTHDFCWSICAFEHLGSIENGLRFVERALATLKPGGVAIHTTEFNYGSDTDTLRTGPTVLFQRQHFSELKRRLEAAGHQVGPLDFDTGDGILDRFVDMPPYEWNGLDPKVWKRARCLKLALSRFTSTCFGVVVRRAG